MTKKKLKLNIDYDCFTGREYALTIDDNPNNRPQLSPTNALIARLLVTGKDKLKEMFGRWPAERQSLVESLQKEEKSPVFDLDGKYTFDLDELIEFSEEPTQLELDFESKRPSIYKKKIKKKFNELSDEQFFGIFRERFKKKFGSYSGVDSDYITSLFLDSEDSKFKPNCKGIVLTAYVQSKDDRRIVPRHYKVKIKGPFEDSKIPLALVSCTCEDYSAAEVKSGYTPNQLVCTHIKEVLEVARYHPEVFENLEERLEKRKTKIRLPWKIHKVDPSLEDLSYILEGKQPELTTLTLGVILTHIFNKQNKFQISKALAKLPVIFEEYFLDKVKKGKAGFEVIPNKYILDEDKGIDPLVMEWFRQMESYYFREGFERSRFEEVVDGKKKAGLKKRYVLENKGSRKHETIAIEYVKEHDDIQEVRRLIFLKGMPPIERKMIFSKDSKPDVFYMEKSKNKPKYVNPYSELFRPHYGRKIALEHFDDASRRMPIFSEHRIPWFIDISKEMAQDYLTVIEPYFKKEDKSGHENFKRFLFSRNKFLREPYKDERMNVFSFLDNLKQDKN